MNTHRLSSFSYGFHSISFCVVLNIELSVLSLLLKKGWKLTHYIFWIHLQSGFKLECSNESHWQDTPHKGGSDESLSPETVLWMAGKCGLPVSEGAVQSSILRSTLSRLLSVAPAGDCGLLWVVAIMTASDNVSESRTPAISQRGSWSSPAADTMALWPLGDIMFQFASPVKWSGSSFQMSLILLWINLLVFTLAATIFLFFF